MVVMQENNMVLEVYSHSLDPHQKEAIEEYLNELQFVLS